MLHLFDFSLCSLATLAMSFFSRALSCSRICSITTRQGLSSVAVSFKLRKFRCRIEKKKKMKVKLIKLIAKMNMRYNRNVYCLQRIDQKFERYRTSTKVWKTSTKLKPCVITISDIFMRRKCPSERCGINHAMQWWLCWARQNTKLSFWILSVEIYSWYTGVDDDEGWRIGGDGDVTISPKHASQRPKNWNWP